MHQSAKIIAQPASGRKPLLSREELLRRLWDNHNPDGSARR